MCAGEGIKAADGPGEMEEIGMLGLLQNNMGMKCSRFSEKCLAEGTCMYMQLQHSLIRQMIKMSKCTECNILVQDAHQSN